MGLMVPSWQTCDGRLYHSRNCPQGWRRGCSGGLCQAPAGSPSPSDSSFPGSGAGHHHWALRQLGEQRRERHEDFQDQNIHILHLKVNTYSHLFSDVSAQIEGVQNNGNTEQYINVKDLSEYFQSPKESNHMRA